jgi:transcriptional regulator with XRE-family HTH domain
MTGPAGFEQYLNGNPHEFFGRAVTCYRAERGWKRKDLCLRASISYSYLHNLEEGLKMPSQQMLGRLAQALDVAPGELIARGERIERGDV